MAQLTPVLEEQPPSTSKKLTYRVKEVWKTLQGEGLFAGRPAVFVRFVGCNMWSGYEEDRQDDAKRTGADCPLWCDTDFTKKGSKKYGADELAKKMLEVAGDVRFCVLTGGEPLLQVNAELVHALHEVGFMVATETNGTVTLNKSCWDTDLGEIIAPDWIVCSPKFPESRLVLEYFDELKLVLPDYMPKDYSDFGKRCREHVIADQILPLLWLQPEDGPRYEAAKKLSIDTALAYPQWRVSVQTHKVLDVA